MSNPKILATRRFEKAFRKASVGLQGLVEGAVHDLVNRIRAEPAQFKRQYGRLAKLPGVLEIDVSGACRLLATHEHNELHLLEVGGHEVVPRYDSGKFLVDQFQKLRASEKFYPEQKSDQLQFFVRNPCLSYAEYGPEQEKEWLYFLSEQQSDALQDVFYGILESLEQGHCPDPVFIVGGPGTGKTSVLINLLKEFVDYGLSCSLSVSDDLARFIDASIPEMEVTRFRNQGNSAPDSDIWLVDDPRYNSDIERQLSLASEKGNSIVIAFDPCQLTSYDSRSRESGISDSMFEQLCEDFRVDPFALSQCYRQKENVGRVAKHTIDLIAESTPFLADHKIEDFRSKHAAVTNLANGLEFPNPFGYCEVYEDPTDSDLYCELDRITSKPLWKHWPPLLLVVDPECDGEDLASFFSPLLDSIDHQITPLNDVETVKGLEFQHVFLVIARVLIEQLENGFQGTGQQEYAKRRLLRIPYSRAKDSMVVFVY